MRKERCDKKEMTKKMPKGCVDVRFPVAVGCFKRTTVSEELCLVDALKVLKKPLRVLQVLGSGMLQVVDSIADALELSQLLKQACNTPVLEEVNQVDLLGRALRLGCWPTLENKKACLGEKTKGMADREGGKERRQTAFCVQTSRMARAHVPP